MILVTVVISTHNRPALLRRAVDSALNQPLGGTAGGSIEVVVVDDGSEPPVELAPNERLRLIRQSSGGVAAARNTGLSAARGSFVTYLDDDDVLTKGALRRALEAQASSTLKAPVAVLAALDEMTIDGTFLKRRLPPTLAAGTPFPLVELADGRSHGVKQTLVVPTAVLRDIGGWDSTFRSRVTTELFMRLGEVCSFEGIDECGYQLTVHDGVRISGDPRVRQQSWKRLVSTHSERMSEHSKGAAALALGHARMSWLQNERRAALVAVMQAMRWSTRRTVRGTVRAIGDVARRRDVS